MLDFGHGVEGVAGEQGSGLGAQARFAERHGYESGLECHIDLLGGEIAFRADGHHAVSAGTVFAAEEPALGGAVAVGDKLLRHPGHLLHKALERRHGADLGQSGLEALLHGRDGNLIEALGLELLALRPPAEQRHEGVEARLGEFFHHPLHAVEMLGGSHGHSDASLPVRLNLLAVDDLHRCALWVRVGEAAGVARALAVDHLDDVAGLLAEHFDTVLRVALGQGECLRYVGCEKLYHILL